MSGYKNPMEMLKGLCIGKGWTYAYKIYDDIVVFTDGWKFSSQPARFFLGKADILKVIEAVERDFTRQWREGALRGVK